MVVASITPGLLLPFCLKGMSLKMAELALRKCSKKFLYSYLVTTETKINANFTWLLNVLWMRKPVNVSSKVCKLSIQLQSSRNGSSPWDLGVGLAPHPIPPPPSLLPAWSSAMEVHFSQKGGVNQIHKHVLCSGYMISLWGPQPSFLCLWALGKILSAGLWDKALQIFLLKTSALQTASTQKGGTETAVKLWRISLSISLIYKPGFVICLLSLMRTE
jgi:hypothetical protein